MKMWILSKATSVKLLYEEQARYLFTVAHKSNDSLQTCPAQWCSIDLKINE